MKAIKNKTSILLAGFISGFNFMNFSCQHNQISNILGSLKVSTSLSGENGMNKDSELLAKDWMMVRADLMSSFNAAQDELPEESA